MTMIKETVGTMVRVGIRPPMVRVGIRPPIANGPKADDEMIALRGELATARAQRDGLQKALDKANRDNDGLRAELRAERERAAEMAGLYEMADRSLMRLIGEKETKSLVDGGITYDLEDEE